MQVPAKRNAGCSIGFECLISHWLTRRGGRTYVRSDISDVITLPKFFASIHFLYSLTHGASLGSAIIVLTKKHGVVCFSKYRRNFEKFKKIYFGCRRSQRHSGKFCSKLVGPKTCFAYGKRNCYSNSNGSHYSLKH